MRITHNNIESILPLPVNVGDNGCNTINSHDKKDNTSTASKNNRNQLDVMETILNSPDLGDVRKVRPHVSSLAFRSSFNR